MTASSNPSLVIFIVEDNDGLRTALCNVLEREGHLCMGLACAEDVEDAVTQQSPNLFLIDLNLPGEDGLSLTRRLRRCQPDVGIVVLTARTQIAERMRGYEEGADLYLAKPIHPGELCAIVASMAKRLKGQAPAEVPSALQVHCARMVLAGPREQQASLTHSELKLLEALARAPDQTLQSWQVATHLGQSESLPSKASVEVRLSRIRKKLIDVGAPSHALKAIKGYGYKLTVPLTLHQR